MLILIESDTVLLAGAPGAFIEATVAPDEDTLAMSLVKLEVPLVLLAIWPN